MPAPGAALLRLATRNLWRSLPRRWPLLGLLAATVAFLFVGNTLFENTTEGLKRSYTNSLTGDWTVSAVGKETFTLFGSDLPLIGEYYVLPSLPHAETILEALRSDPGTVAAVPQVTAAGELKMGKWSAAVPVFGVSFGEYFDFFSDLELISGSLDRGSSGDLLLNETLWEQMTQTLGRAPVPGDQLTISIFNDHSFTIRSLTLRGVFRYPATDKVLNRIVLVDPDTARSLNGYVYGAGEAAVESEGLSAEGLDDLFNQGSDVVSEPSGGLSAGDVEKQLSDTKGRDAQNKTLAGSWNFLLVRGDQPRGLGPEVQVRDWRSSAGGTALVVWLVQLVFNLGLGFVMAGAAFTVINSLSLSVAERTREIGTMRALGASRGRVAGMVSVEVLLVVTGSGGLGLVLGLGVLAFLNRTGVVLDNSYLQAPFGTSLLRPQASLAGVFSHLLFILALGVVSLVQPVALALRISPIRAMARGR